MDSRGTAPPPEISRRNNYCILSFYLSSLHYTTTKPGRVMSFDAFEARMQFLQLLRKLNASQQSIHKVVGYAIKYGSKCGEDLWECILEECGKVCPLASHQSRLRREDRWIGLIVGITEYTYKPTIPTRLPTRDILTTPTIRCSLSAINIIESIRDSKEGSTRKRGCIEFKSSKTG